MTTIAAPLAKEHQRTRNGELEVFVQGVGVARGKSEWCPVLRHHYLRSGNAPDGSSAHSCVTNYYGGTTPCEQFICYQPEALY